MITFRNKLLNFPIRSEIELTEKPLNQKNLILLIILRIAPIILRNGKELDQLLT